jgi:hypothetical protein
MRDELLEYAIAWGQDGSNCGYCDKALTDGVYLSDEVIRLRDALAKSESLTAEDVARAVEPYKTAIDLADRLITLMFVKNGHLADSSEVCALHFDFVHASSLHVLSTTPAQQGKKS